MELQNYNDKSLTALQSFIKVREKIINKNDKRVVEEKVENKENNISSTEKDLLTIVNKFRK